MRTLSVKPAPAPTLRAVMIAFAFSTRSAPGFATVMSKLVTIQAARASSWAGALIEMNSPKRIRPISNLQFASFIFQVNFPFVARAYESHAGFRAAVPSAQAATCLGHLKGRTPAHRELP